MGVSRAALVTALGGTLFVVTACATGEAPTSTLESEVELDPPRVPDPPPRYARVAVPEGPVPTDTNDESKLQIRCGGHQPYVCTLDDGSFRCSDLPCVPSCDRVGCLGGEVCLACDGGFRCVASGGTC